ncbi:MAG: hypothetical protein RIG61_09335 [Deltaproteobacteria bacterium]
MDREAEIKNILQMPSLTPAAELPAELLHPFLEITKPLKKGERNEKPD